MKDFLTENYYTVFHALADYFKVIFADLLRKHQYITKKCT